MEGLSDRPISPYLELKPNARKGSTELDYFQMKLGREKIHRIRTRFNYLAYVTHVTSPSEIWVRPINHIADKLTLPFSDTPPLEKELKEDVYVMTPLDEDVLVRARILKFCDVKEKYLLRLIDHGKPVYRDAEDIFEMKSEKDEMRKHPWQAIPIVLQGVDPENSKTWTDAEICKIFQAFSEFSVYIVTPTLHEVIATTWTDAEICTIFQAFSEFLVFIVTPTLHEVIAVNDDSFYTRASINGLKEDDLEFFKTCKRNDKALLETFGYSIAEYYNMLLRLYVPFNEPKTSFVKQKHFSYPDQYDDVNEIEYKAFHTPSKDVDFKFLGFDYSNIQTTVVETTSGIDVNYDSKSNEDFSRIDNFD
uniref:Tudor domain-containing protein n=1 Tax=Panagrolaimus sp. ES5 TaxID=591445 RepID=A0AC34G686_9BILA